MRIHSAITRRSDPGSSDANAALDFSPNFNKTGNRWALTMARQRPLYGKTIAIRFSLSLFDGLY